MAMTQKERSAKFYKIRKENGLCPRCGNALDREGHYCSECLEKVNYYKKENRIFYREHNICTECGKEVVFGHDKICPECRAKINSRRKPLTDEQKQRYEERFKKQQKSLYQERKEQGICTRCGKIKTMPGKAKCGICLAKDAAVHRKTYMAKPDIRKYRIENGLCYRCGEKLDREGKYCTKCQNDIEEHLAEARKKQTFWKEDNKLVFGNGVSK